MNASTFQPILEELHHNSTDVIASTLIAVDGIPLCSILPRNADADRVGGMSAAMLSLGQRTTKELLSSQMKQLIVESQDGFILLVQATDDLVLVTTARKEAKLGMIMLHVRQAVAQIRQVA
ncbi:roadblock/LC7 domain-containing protein [Kingella negevensis]|uniref:Roadblock/LC7 domain protein n=1 Tax=Kingella negevensis TaxID=1522312 RepID=A0A238HD17_9NEIS|nr:roadblock/LC7 domain-containing protein [Kingella negevensis]MDK4679330.1 roadblock/LC7 domain-containing protein [Kingella negevensis]MDK4682949.1 roadblock/LC7 domain-containing protein [Kingella negevensis]MDK4685153.1 roadblock/LC7 domain-containing protein [Kingella negevensis]MDK4688379.1 roadblock/LC7 domain-containing protein [Kingella negevensis]MDK4691149.1 roadblock/LC7 domain-containing protein [Kingella negevensis]